ncbi:N-acetyltransferase family protein [Dokdonella sp.]|uniref:GNAT family N-acetyltransferase n=1 Tax=Dokdonella sp. TaxID=2291710 RepID=UPI003C48C973
MRFRLAEEHDIPGMTEVRLAVVENRLSDPGWLTRQMWMDALAGSGNACSWVCELDGRILGFSTGRVRHADIWALFVDPRFEGQGIGSRLLELAVEWMNDQGVAIIELSTADRSRADVFYQRKGWRRGERNAKGEVVFQWQCNHPG